MFYVLHTAGARSWVLSLDGYATRAAAAAAAIAWQVEGGECRTSYSVTTYDGRRGAFVSQEARPDGGPGLLTCTWEPDRGPYTPAAWAAFAARLGGRMLQREALEAAESFLSGFEDDAAQDRSALALVRAAIAAGEACDRVGMPDVGELRDNMPDVATQARHLAWTPPPPPPGYAVFETPSGRWAWERQDGGACGVGYLDRAQAVSRAYGDVTARGEQG